MVLERLLQVDLLKGSFVSSPTQIHDLMPTRKAGNFSHQLQASGLPREVPQDQHASQR